MANPNLKRRTSEISPKKVRFRLLGWVPAPFKRFWRRYNVGRILMLTFTLFLLLVTGYLYFLSKTANVQVLQKSISAQTQIYDAKGQLADSLQGQKGTPTTYDKLPKALKDAIISTEDRTFYKNNGVNVARTLLAVFTAGHFGGGSTITQQIAKNAYLSQERTADRKAREIFLALQITKHYTKDQILTMYVNQNNYGNGIWGAEDASERYFGVPVNELTVDEAATIAGIPNYPAAYNPLYDNAKYATLRRNVVLQNMVEAGYLTQAECNKYKAIDMKTELKNNYQAPSATYKYPSYDNAVIAEAKKTYNLTADQIVNGGYKIFTGMNQDMQDGMQKTYADLTLFPQAADGTYAQGSSVATDPKSGEVRALVGNVGTDGYNSYTDFNFATQAQRSTGSAIKPLIAYAPAISAGWAIDKTVNDSARNYNGWKPTDAEAGWRGDMPLYQALAMSYNIPAIDTYKAIGTSTGNALGLKFGITSLKTSAIPLSTVLGSGIETNPWQIAQAYGTFANGGAMQQSHLITKIEDASGKVLETANPKLTNVISSATADKMNQMMLGTFTNGTGLNAGPDTYELAGKTGTNEDVDQWVIGYTPDLVVAEWLGYANPQHYKLDGTSWSNASIVFRQEASYMFPYTAGTKFNVENAYAAHGISADTPAWTYQRQAQDDIVATEQQQAGTTGNSTPASNSNAASSSSSSTSGFDIIKTAKDLWNKFTSLFK
ncbi:MAG: PBP1A family penicillin-binding protein [Streptococcaceae bacterium]|jgi:penicillin-binding protein 2A|nr:PBP1A family penicillin-binding protein [Streptococcaceae bacterium]